MITGIYIENFKGIGEPGIKLDLAPVTLLFGNNSAGKSSVFHALLLAYEVLVRGNRNPDKTELGGSVVDLGGFQRFVHLHEDHRTVRLRFDLDLSSVSLDKEWPIPEELLVVSLPSPYSKLKPLPLIQTGGRSFEIDASRVGEDVWSASVQIELSWDDATNAPFVSRYEVAIDETSLAVISDFRLTGGGVNLNVDPTHPVFKWTREEIDVSFGILDYMVPELRTEAETLFCRADSLSDQDDYPETEMDIEEDTEDRRDFPEQNREPHTIHDLETEQGEDDPWDEDQNNLRDLFSIGEDEYLADAADGDGEELQETDKESVSDFFTLEVESPSRVKKLGKIEHRSLLVDDEVSGRMFDVTLYRTDSGKIGVLYAEFEENQSWTLKEAQSALYSWLTAIDFEDNEDEQLESRSIPLQAQDALPDWHSPLTFEMNISSDEEDEDDRNRFAFVSQLLTRLISVPGRVICDSLDSSRYIGPLREIPSRQFSLPSTPDRSRWSTGLGAWDFLLQCPEETVLEISDWLSDEKRIGTRHGITRRMTRFLPSDSFEIKKLHGDDYFDEIERIRDLIMSRKEEARIEIHDHTLNVYLDPHDCAIGLAQLVPVVVAGVMSRTESDKKGIFLVEQPELHNHPSVEVGLGDLFIETIQQKHCRFILETHGEHLMLRILRRIRETSEKELPEGVSGLLPEEVAVYFIERTVDGVTAKRLRVDETGEFIDKWPKGFFRERAEELF